RNLRTERAAIDAGRRSTSARRQGDCQRSDWRAAGISGRLAPARPRLPPCRGPQANRCPTDGPATHPWGWAGRAAARPRAGLKLRSRVSNPKGGAWVSGFARAFAWSINPCGCRKSMRAFTPMKQEAFHSPKSRRQRVNDPDGTKRDIIDVATEEFSGKGFSGARVDNIAARTKTRKRMLYYTSGGKEGLYIAVLEAAYRRIRTVEATLDLEKQRPEQALRALIAFTFDYQ